MHATVVDYFGAHRAPGYGTASAFDPGPHIAETGIAHRSRAQVLAHCVDILLARNPEVVGSRLVIVEAAQTTGAHFPSNLEEYQPTPSRTHPRLASWRRDRLVISHACASAGLALAVAAALIQRGRCDYALVLGATAPGFIEQAAFASAGALTGLEHCRPFDASADGTALGFFVGAVILGAETAARADRPVISGIGVQTLGLGAQSDPDSQLACMTSAVRQAGITPGFVAAHATGTKHGDRVELDAVAALGRSLDTELYVSSCKGEVGHSVHSAGLASALVAFETLRVGRIFGTQHCLDPIEAPGARVVPHGHIVDHAAPRAGIVNAFGFGGTSCSILVQKGRE
ncbi:beta-ketoacyl synthase N-terminal-like domain-containing protein [Nocardia sp. NPDC020380]|uniref:beta-ketoacyl synthase N-terminal-like domain-containing protein n=1 Tax=Nocardia sp. NPDC020380 TaxID=3364309 RepID=UPI003798DBC5